MKSPKFYLEHIVEAADRINEYTEEISFEDFVKDDMRYYATIHLIEQIGEASGKLEEEFKTTHNSIPWQQIKAMRNRLTHEYWMTDLEQVWKTATEEVPELKSKIEVIRNKVNG